MRIVDCHVHMSGPVTDPKAVLKSMDENGIERMIVLSQVERESIQETRAKLLQAKALCDVAPDRLTGLAWVEPTLPGMRGLIKEALLDMGFAGVKIIPDHWYAYEERLEPWWETLNELEARVLFHTGILYGFEDGSRFNHPLYLEKLVFYPKIRFAMAHISWPWCEECMAVMGRMRAARDYDLAAWQSYVDLTPGTPKYIRKQAISNALEMCGVERLLFGTDASIPGDLAYQRRVLEMDLQIFAELGLDEARQQRILAGTADELFPGRK